MKLEGSIQTYTGHNSSISKTTGSSSTYFQGSYTWWWYTNCRAYAAGARGIKILYTWYKTIPHDLNGIYIYLLADYDRPSEGDEDSDWEADSNDDPFSEYYAGKNYQVIKTPQISNGGLGQIFYTNTQGYQYFMIVIKEHAEDEDNLHWFGLLNLPSSNILTTSSPPVQLSGQTLKIGKLVDGKRILQFYRTNDPLGGSTEIDDPETLHEFVLTSLINCEPGIEWYDSNPYLGYYGLKDNPRIHRWNPGDYTVSVDLSGATLNRERISGAIDAAIGEINGALAESSTGITFSRDGSSGGDIEVIVGTHANLFPDTPSGYYYGGQWETNVDSNTGVIQGAKVKLACDLEENYHVYFTTYETIALEEITQTLGAGYDQIEYPYNTLHTDFNYHNKSSILTGKDKNIIKLLYSPDIETNDLYYDVCQKLNVKNGYYMVPTDNDRDVALSVNLRKILIPGTYSIQVFIVDSWGRITAWSTPISVEVTEMPPSNCRIYDSSSGEWKLAIPYIYSDGVWKQAQSLIYDGSTWKS